MLDQINAAIRSIPDFPKPGIIFKDITPVLRDPQLFAAVVDIMADRWRDKHIDAVVGVDARGFITGGALAYALGVGFVPIRKEGKLPWETLSASYDLEYGSNTIQIHADGVAKGENVLLVDDLLATGGTAKAAVSLIERLGANVAGIEFMVELTFLHGRERLAPHPVFSLVSVD